VEDTTQWVTRKLTRFASRSTPTPCRVPRRDRDRAAVTPRVGRAPPPECPDRPTPHRSTHWTQPPVSPAGSELGVRHLGMRVQMVN